MLCRCDCRPFLLPSVQSYAESMLMEIFPIVVACGLVEGRCVGGAGGGAGWGSTCMLPGVGLTQLPLHVRRVSDFTLQVTGKESYIHGPVELITFSHIRRWAAF